MKSPDDGVDPRLAELFEAVRELAHATATLDKKVDAVIRHLYLDRALLGPTEQVLADRFPMRSQHEEAGMLFSLFKVVGAPNRRFVEFGAGLNGGNCGVLAAEAGWDGLLVDEAVQCINELELQFAATRGRVVQWSVAPDNVNEFLVEQGVTGEVDLLSIDIDGPDYWVWEAITAITPRVVVIEYNAVFGPEASVTIPYARDFDRRRLKGNDRMYFGASLAAMERLGRRKGFRLVCCDPSGANAFFVRDGLAPQLAPRTPAEAFRWLPKSRNVVLRVGDAVRYFTERNLPLVEISH